jgi:hypothetical protein
LLREFYFLFISPIRNRKHDLHEARIKFIATGKGLTHSATYLCNHEYINFIVSNGEFRKVGKYKDLPVRAMKACGGVGV